MVSPLNNWKIENTPNIRNSQLQDSEWTLYCQWTGLIRNQDMHPKEAARKLGMQMENVGKEFSVRLSEGSRIYFSYDDQKKEVKISQVGGHR